MSLQGNESLPLLHKYVLSQGDDLKLVMSKLQYRLCVRDVTKVLYHRSQGHSISEAVDICENVSESTMSSNNHQMEPLVFEESGDSHSLSSPQTDYNSPSSESYCGTMKSDDSGIGMDDGHLNFSSDVSEMNMSSHGINSPIYEQDDDYYKSNGITSAESFIEDEIQVQVENQQSSREIDEFFDRVKAEEGNYPQPEYFIANEVQIIVEEASDVEQTSENEDLQEDIVGNNSNIKFEEDLSPSEIDDSQCPLYTPDDELIDGLFISGLKCTDVDTALIILKTKYRLNQPCLRKFIITFSAWNLSQVMYGPDKRATWWADNKEPQETEEVEDLMEKIYQRQGEISDLVDRIMEEKALHQRAVAAAAAKSPQEPQITPDDVIIPDEAQPSDNAEDVPKKKTRRNILQRLMHALRKRVRGGNRSNRTNQKGA